MSIASIAACARIDTDRLTIVPLTAEHARRLFPEFRKPELYMWISSQPPEAADDLVRSWWCTGDNGPGECDGHVNLDWAVLRNSDGQAIGKLDAEFLGDHLVTNLGYLISPRYWNRGYGTEAVKSLSETFEDGGVREQRAFVTDGNLPSMRLLKRIGFRPIGLIRNNDRIRGKMVDDIEFRRTVRG